jgi:hypothetical protein
MTADDFRAIALSLPEAVESAHMDHPDFRVGGKIFATLGPKEAFGVVLVTPEQQAALVKAEPKMFEAVKGGWGAGGATQVNLRPAREGPVRAALGYAWRKRAPKKLAQQYPED